MSRAKARKCFTWLVTSYIASMQPFEQKQAFLSLAEEGNFLSLYKEAATLSDPSRSRDSVSYHEAAQLLAFFKKNEDPGLFVDPTVDPEAVAWGTWLDTERRCRLFNLNFESCDNRMLRRVKHEVWQILGDEPESAWLDRCYVTSGAALGVHGDCTNIVRRFTMDNKWTVTSGALWLALEALHRTRLHHRPLADGGEHELRVCPRVVRGNKLSFVPKTTETYRSVAVEPLLNVFLQTGIDRAMRDRLKKRAGIDLQDQFRSQNLARIGSIDGSLATIDLSSASDCISRRLAQFLLPYGWRRVCDSARSPYTMYKGSEVELEKYVTQGNSFCFPLQTVIFTAICRACGDKTPTVYGDDIIVRTDCAQDVIETLASLGMVANVNKTFTSGPFRESCGADWWSGKAVRPVYVRASWCDVRNIASFHNVASVKGPLILQLLLPELRKFDLGVSKFLRPVEYSRDRFGGEAFNCPLDEAVSTRFVRYNRQFMTMEWKEIKSIPAQDLGAPRLEGYEFLWYLNGLSRIGSPDAVKGDDLPSRRRKTRTVIGYSL